MSQRQLKAEIVVTGTGQRCFHLAGRKGGRAGSRQRPSASPAPCRPLPLPPQVSLFEVEATPESVAAFIEREHEFRWGGHMAGALCSLQRLLQAGVWSGGVVVP